MYSCGSSPEFAGGSRPLPGRTLHSCKALPTGLLHSATKNRHTTDCPCDECSESHLSLRMSCIKLQRA